MSINRPIKIAMYDPSGHGGICHYTYQLAQNLASVEADVTLLTTEAYELKHLPRSFVLNCLFKESRIKRWAACLVFASRADRCTIRDIPRFQVQKNNALISWFKKLRLRITWVKAIILLLRNGTRLIHFQWLVDRSQELFFIKCLKLLGFKMVYTVHDVVPQEPDASTDYRVIEKVYRQMDRLIVHAEVSKAELIRLFKVDPGKIHVIPHGSNDLFGGEKHAPPREAAKKNLGISPAQKVILFFGIIKRYKGLEYLVEAFQDIKKQVNEAVLLIVGSIYERDTEGFRYYSQLIGEIGTRDDVFCVPEYVPFGEIAHYFSAADVVVLPYTQTSTSGVLLAAYAAGRPVVVTDTGALPEVVESGKSGIVVPPKDSRALSQAIIAILNGSCVDAMGRYAKHLADTQYSWKTVALKTTDLYRRLAANG